MDLSIIVPVYNVEKYLLKCVDSLLNQDLKDDSYEIILINDGSTDNSLDLCIKLQNHYPNIKLYNQSNQGVGAARNKGITEAQGRFIAFVDSDDYLLFGGLGRLINIIRDNPYVDIVHFLSDYDGRVLKDLNYNIDYMGAASFLLEKSGLPAFVWIYLYRKEFLIKNKIWFKNYKFSEDTLFISTVFLHNPYVISTQASIYRYVLREGSAITNNNRVHLKRVVEDNLSSYEDVLKELDLSIFKNSTKVYTACTKSINLKKISCYSRILQPVIHLVNSE